MRVLNLEEIKDILNGCTILGTGGGGSLEEGMFAVMNEWNAGKQFKMLDFDEIEDEAFYANPYYCGSITPEGEEEVLTGEEITSSVIALEEYMGVEFSGLVSIEYGGGNTGEAMAAAAKLNKYIVDADAAGRAVPELQFSTYYITNQPIAPFAVGTSYGDIAIVAKVQNDARAEALSRFMAVGSNGTVGMTDHPIKGSALRTSVIPGALSHAGRVGRAFREAGEQGRDPIEAILKAAEGVLLFRGRVTKDTGWKLEDGFTLGDIILEGIEGDAGHKARVWYKNENMVMWVDDEVRLTCPDLICTVENKTGRPVTNPNCTEGMELCVFGAPCHELWKTERGLEILNPGFFGFDMECKFLDNKE